ncbi:hypothetical protein EWM64_g2175 [Hericium alpestre]|uniref:Uncharacterized protein n=1 Tax=Hericium alpestre TaxID=135208 RepID=A0A4Z0A7C5_9AGAM|nr:hypothetical protein EWM64_g2175 [Hericium alpestre]
MHPNCSEDCPAFKALVLPKNVAKRVRGCREPTEEELATWPLPGKDTADLFATTINEDQVMLDNETDHCLAPNDSVSNAADSGRSSDAEVYVLALRGSIPDWMAGVSRRTFESLLRIGYIVDPSGRSSSYKKAGNEATYVTTSLKPDAYRRIEAFVGTHVFIAGNQKPPERGSTRQTRVRIYEWLWVMLQVMMREPMEEEEPKIEVSFIRWEDFRGAMLNLHTTPNASPFTIDDLARDYHCIIGGLDESVNWTNPNKGYGITSPSEWSSFQEAYTTLTGRVRIWPSRNQTVMRGNKKALMESLDAAARELTRTPRPTTEVLSMYGGRAEIPREGPFVLKRTHSDCGADVIIVADPGPHNITIDCLSAKEHFPVPDYVWLLQDYAPLLSKVGEWRAFVIGGRLVRTVHTVKRPDKTWIVRAVHGFCPLQELSRRWVRDGCSEIVLADTIRYLSTLTYDEREAGRVEFETFVCDTYRALVRRESLPDFVVPSIAQFCRIDIGLWEHDGRLHYFVNEVERGASTTGLWFHVEGLTYDHTVNSLATTFGIVFGKWLGRLQTIGFI